MYIQSLDIPLHMSLLLQETLALGPSLRTFVVPYNEIKINAFPRNQFTDTSSYTSHTHISNYTRYSMSPQPIKAGGGCYFGPGQSLLVQNYQATTSGIPNTYRPGDLVCNGPNGTCYLNNVFYYSHSPT